MLSYYLHLPDFLSPDLHQKLIDFSISKEQDFVPTTTATQAENYRESVVLYKLEEWAWVFEEQLLKAVPIACAHLHIPVIDAPSKVEMQLTAHNDGQFYKVHNDNGSPDTAARVLTYVYYYHREPKGFSDGQLRLYDGAIVNGFLDRAETYRDIEPVNNSIVFFLSKNMHEVLPIVCPSREFADSRFTINGWIHA